MSQETHITLQMPGGGDEYEVQLTEEQRETVDAACDYLDMELGLLVNAASKWNGANNPELSDRIGREMGRRARRSSPEQKEKLQQRAKERFLKQAILNFSRFIVENEPTAEWMAGNDELRFGGELGR